MSFIVKYSKFFSFYGIDESHLFQSVTFDGKSYYCILKNLTGIYVFNEVFVFQNKIPLEQLFNLIYYDKYDKRFLLTDCENEHVIYILDTSFQQVERIELIHDTNTGPIRYLQVDNNTKKIYVTYEHIIGFFYLDQPNFQEMRKFNSIIYSSYIHSHKDCTIISLIVMENFKYQIQVFNHDNEELDSCDLHIKSSKHILRIQEDASFDIQKFTILEVLDKNLYQVSNISIIHTTDSLEKDAEIIRAAELQYSTQEHYIEDDHRDYTEKNRFDNTNSYDETYGYEETKHYEDSSGYEEATLCKESHRCDNTNEFVDDISFQKYHSKSSDSTSKRCDDKRHNCDYHAPSNSFNKIKQPVSFPLFNNIKLPMKSGLHRESNCNGSSSTRKRSNRNINLRCKLNDIEHDISRVIRAECKKEYIEHNLCNQIHEIECTNKEILKLLNKIIESQNDLYNMIHCKSKNNFICTSLPTPKIDCCCSSHKGNNKFRLPSYIHNTKVGFTPYHSMNNCTRKKE